MDGKQEQAENNLDAIAYFIEHFGYMPNANHLLDSSQPPLFTRGVWELYRFTGETEIIKKYLDPMIKEYTFFQLDRNTCIGLNQYGSELNKSRALTYYEDFSHRVGEFRDTIEGKSGMVKDLNCLLYDVEIMGLSMYVAK